jgi:hypothetical protein
MRAVPRLYKNIPPLLTVPKGGTLINNKYILYVNMELCKYFSGDHNIKINIKCIQNKWI